jgi:hypothetical protein
VLIKKLATNRWAIANSNQGNAAASDTCRQIEKKRLSNALIRGVYRNENPTP